MAIQLLNPKFVHFNPPDLIPHFFRKFGKLKQGLAKYGAKIKVFVF